MDRYYNQNPGLREQTMALHQKMVETSKKYLERHENSKEVEMLEDIVIPVVWHILEGSGIDPVTDAEINAEMEWINQWYSATNTYYNDRSSFWASSTAVASDFHISFALATVDPNGNPTTGINRYSTPVANSCGDVEIFRSSEGGVDIWNSLHYMNVYACGTISSAGYAYLPGSNTHFRDAMVIRSTYIGDTGITGSIFAHEMGHWLGLPHTFKQNAPTCTGNVDGISDTPDSDAPGFNYVSWNRCRPGQSGLTDSDFQRCGNRVMIQNCMDYNYEPCKSYFSKGQVAVMRNYLDTPTSVRGQLKNSPGLAQSQPSQSRTRTPAPPTGTSTPSRTRTPVPSTTPSSTRSPIPSASRTPTRTSTGTPTRTRTPSRSVTRTSSISITESPGASHSPTPSNTPTRTPTASRSETNTASASRAASESPSASESRAPSESRTSQPSESRAPSPSSAPSDSPSATRTRTPVPPSSTRSRSSTGTPTVTPGRPGGFIGAILDKVNYERANVDPAPRTPLTPLEWSNTLQQHSQAHVDNCVWTSSGGPYAEYRYAYSHDQTGDEVLLAENTIDSWASKKAYYTLTAEGGSCAPGQSCSSYVQMIWDVPQSPYESYRTTHIGCGYKHCTQNSPFGTAYNGEWTMFVCNYEGRGNWIGLLPYVPCAADECSSGGCTASCPEGSCGEQIICGQAIDCGPCCSSPCDVHDCGTHQNSCGNYINCGNCNEGSTCTVDNGNFICVQDPPPCIHADECTAAGFTCGNHNFCGIVTTCQPNNCPEGTRCDGSVCENDPCFGCPYNSHCVNDECICDEGFIELDGACIQPQNGGGGLPDYSNDFVQSLPAPGAINFVVDDTVTSLVGFGTHILEWQSTRNIVDRYTTQTKAVVVVGEGEIGFNVRHNQGVGRENDRIFWSINNLGSDPQIAICLAYYGNFYCSGRSPINFPSNTPIEVEVGMNFDPSSGNVLVTWACSSDSTTRTGYTRESYYPQLGSISYYWNRPSGITPTLTGTTLITSTTLTVSLSECIDDAAWEQMFYDLTGADPATTSVQIRGDGENANCGKSAGKVLLSGFTMVVSSASVPAASLGSLLVSSIGSPGAASIGLTSVAIVPGATGAALAGFPTSVAALGASAIGISAGAAGAGGAGGAAGLSGGAIAGIVVGSVAGAVLLVGITTVIIAAIIVAAVVLAKGGDDSPAPVDNSAKRKSVRNTIKGFFGGGVDVMNNPEGKSTHQSITARSPGEGF